MSGAQLAQSSLITLGAVAIAAAMFRTRGLMELEAPERRARWQVLRAMMGGFLLGYGGAIWLILAGTEHVLGWLVGFVFLGGAAFVYAVISLSLDSLQQLVATSHSRESFQTTLDTVVDAIVTIDEGGKILFANSGTTKTFGYSGEEMLGRNVKMLMPSEYAEQHDGYIRRYLETGEARIIDIGREVTGVRKDGTSFPAELGISEMRVGGARRFVGSLRDISDRKEVDRMKSEFISTVSHELRTPLTSIRGSLGLLLGGVGGGLSDKTRGLLEIGVRSCDRLVRLINDILDVEKIESGALKMKRREVAVDSLLSTAIDSTRSFADEHGVRIESPVDCPAVLVNVDEDRIQQVLTNLISNAVKFSPDGGLVRLLVHAAADRVRFEVRDEGPGIPLEFQPRLFERFAQADASPTRKVAGSGLGLSIAKAIVEQHDGTIGFDTESQAGAIFFFELPISAADRVRSEPREPSGEANASSNAPRVMVCEDDEDLAHIIAETLRREGCICDVVANGAQAKEGLARHRYDALFLDLFLPGQDGISLIRELRGNEATRDLPIVVVSAVAGEGRAQLAGQSFQVVDWIDKPFDEDELRLSLRSALWRASESQPRILHVEDDLDIVAIVRGYLAPDAHVVPAPTLGDARRALDTDTFDLVLLDLQLPDGNGLELVSLIQALEEPPPILVFSAHDMPVDARAQVEGVLSKGAAGGDLLVHTARRLLAQRGTRASVPPT